MLKVPERIKTRFEEGVAKISKKIHSGETPPNSEDLTTRPEVETLINELLPISDIPEIILKLGQFWLEHGDEYKKLDLSTDKERSENGQEYRGRIKGLFEYIASQGQKRGNPFLNLLLSNKYYSLRLDFKATYELNDYCVKLFNTWAKIYQIAASVGLDKELRSVLIPHQAQVKPQMILSVPWHNVLHYEDRIGEFSTKDYLLDMYFSWIEMLRSPDAVTVNFGLSRSQIAKLLLDPQRYGVLDGHDLVDALELNH